MSIKEKMRPYYQTVQGGLFGDVTKADVGGGVDDLVKNGVALMSWADPFMPDPSIPEEVIEETYKAAKGGFPAHYTMPIGSLELRELLAQRIERKWGLKLDPKRNLIINPGSDVGLMMAMTPWINLGDEVLVHDPSYASNFVNPELLGGKSVRVKTYAEDDFHLRISEYEKALTPKTKMVLLNNPNNPTGVTYTRKELEELAAFIVKNDLVCVVDQAFEDTIFPESEFTVMATLPGMWERTVTIGSVSKGFGLSGYRIGWLYTNDVLMDVYHGIAVNIQGATSTLSQMAVQPAIRNDAYIQKSVEIYDRRRHYAYNKFNACKGVSMKMPESTFLAWVCVKNLEDSSIVTDRAAKEAKVSLNDGKFYGTEGDGYLRISLATFADDKDFEAAIDRVAALFDKIAEEKGL